ncbi:elongation of very long chain fatty acids protein 6-like [Patiria miniata]|uniref:Elongation of very long chain fatty acids protein n=1 Tax=Patiria miniata TaxID=46514 RepID=A0A913ZPC4_PATMI|nr:elongation of very long chain fatty acids protein 6-like [Patiria miniata]
MDTGHLVYSGIGPAERFSFEEDFDAVSCTDVLKEYRVWIIPISIVYVLLVFAGRRWMQDRPAYRLKGPLILWNILLGGFSLIGAWRIVPVFSKALFYNGWHSTVCDNVYYHKDFLGIWGLLFTLSKIPELGDTLFIVLRKQKLIFLHWYHHATVPLFVFAVYSELGAPGVWFTAMNYFVHGLMYPYYGIRAVGFRLPKVVAMAITSLQIFQMIMGNILVGYAAVMRLSGVTCQIDQRQLTLAVILYFSYLLLFGNFFYTSYFGSKRAAPKPVKADSKPDNQANGFSNHVTNGHVTNVDNDQDIRQRDLTRFSSPR